MNTVISRAVRVSEPTEPSNLQVSKVEHRLAGEDLLIKVLAAGVNRSDALACRGVIPGPYPRILGRDFAGEVVDGPDAWLGRRVWGSGGSEFGLSRDGTHAEFLVTPPSTVAILPDGLDYVDAAASGLSYVTASAAWLRAGAHFPGATVVVTGAVGGVGAAAAGLASAGGARVVGVVLEREEATALAEPGIDEVVCSDRDDVAGAIRDLTAGEGAAFAVDTVGGALVADLAAAMAIGGCITVLSTPPGDATAPINMLDYYRSEVRLHGLHTGRLPADEAAALLELASDGLSSGQLRPSRVHGTYPLEDAAAAYHAVERAVVGRPVFLPHDN